MAHIEIFELGFGKVKMASVLFLGMQNSLVVAEETKSGWRVQEKLVDKAPQSIAVDPAGNEIVYCATYEDGLWKSDDAGQKWTRIGQNFGSQNTMSVAIAGSKNALYAGTEPSSLYRSDAQGKSWIELEGMTKLESSSMWSFPPRPYTHHVRWIGPDASNPDHLYVAIEAGALVQSLDGGKTWIDKVKSGPFDTHTLATSSKIPGKVFSSAGDGYFESADSGQSWKRLVFGLEHRYCYGLALCPSNPQISIISCASSAFEAHYPGAPQSFIYTKDDSSWHPPRGLPEAEGTFVSILYSTKKEIYALNNRGLFSSEEGSHWKRVDIPWKNEYLKEHPWALAAS
jgi:hypothetical protein